jgi:hypothetical protein
MIKPLMKVIRGKHDTWCYNPPSLKEISSRDLWKEGEHKKTMKSASMSKKRTEYRDNWKKEFFPVSPATSLFNDRSISPCGMWRFLMVLLGDFSSHDLLGPATWADARNGKKFLKFQCQGWCLSSMGVLPKRNRLQCMIRYDIHPLG